MQKLGSSSQTGVVHSLKDTENENNFPAKRKKSDDLNTVLSRALMKECLTLKQTFKFRMMLFSKV